MAQGRRADAVGVDEVRDLRALLRRSDAASRRRAVEHLRSWRSRGVAPDAAATVLVAATVAYPYVGSVPDDVGEALVELLWAAPHDVDPAEVERAYRLCSERGRRAVLALLARRADDDAVTRLCTLLGPEGPADLLPVARPELLTPVLAAPGVERLVPALVAVSWRRGWTSHAASLLGDMRALDRLRGPDAAAASAGLAPLAMSLLDTCDRALLAQRLHGDLARAERQRLDDLLPLLARLPGGTSEGVLRRALGSADPRVAARAVLAMAGRGLVVGEERVSLVARDPEARAILAEGLGSMGRHFLMPPQHGDERALAEACLVAWLASVPQMGRAPDEVEHRMVSPCPLEWGRGRLHVFAFRVRPPHWSAERGWMLAAVGPWEPDATFVPRHAEGFAVHSLYAAEDAEPLAAHVLAISDALVHLREENAA